MSMSEYDNDLAYHRPVMLTQCLNGLDLQPDGRYVDVTFGGGGTRPASSKSSPPATSTASTRMPTRKRKRRSCLAHSLHL